jgi:hypothetical protein
MTILRATLFQSYQGQILENVLIFQGGGQGDASEMEALADDVQNGWIALVKTEQVTDLRYFQVKVEALGSFLAPFLKTMNIAGTNGGNNNDKTTYAHVIRKRTGFAGKSGRGRSYIGGIANNADQNSFLDQGRLNSWASVLFEIMAVFGDGGTSSFRLGITSKVDPANHFKQVTSLQIAPQYSNVQRRKVGRGI